MSQLQLHQNSGTGHSVSPSPSFMGSQRRSVGSIGSLSSLVSNSSMLSSGNIAGGSVRSTDTHSQLYHARLRHGGSSK